MSRKEQPEPEHRTELDRKGTARAQRRRYAAPHILSAEPLEAAAATCSPPAPPFGKTFPGICTQLGS